MDSCREAGIEWYWFRWVGEGGFSEKKLDFRQEFPQSSSNYKLSKPTVLGFITFHSPLYCRSALMYLDVFIGSCHFWGYKNLYGNKDICPVIWLNRNWPIQEWSRYNRRDPGTLRTILHFLYPFWCFCLGSSFQIIVGVVISSKSHSVRNLKAGFAAAAAILTNIFAGSRQGAVCTEGQGTYSFFLLAYAVSACSGNI